MKININDSEKLEKAIEEAEGRAKARLIDAYEIQRAADYIDHFLEDRLYKKDQKGIEFHVDIHAQSFPSSYRGIPESTHFWLKKCSTGWFVTDIRRCNCLGPSAMYSWTNISSYQDKREQYLRDNLSGLI